MDPLDEPKTTFITNTQNYQVMPFDLKNICTTYQRYMDTMTYDGTIMPPLRQTQQLTRQV